MSVLVKHVMSRGVAQRDQPPSTERAVDNGLERIKLHLVVREQYTCLSMDYARTHALSGTNGVGQASNRPSHPARSNDNSRVALLVCDERLLAFLDYLEGHGV